jgi:amino acid transporter
MVLRIGKPGALFLWVFVCMTAFFVCQTALQAASRTVYAFSRDRGEFYPHLFRYRKSPSEHMLLGLPQYFGHISNATLTPIRAIWFTTILSIIPGLLDLASPIAANAIFALTAMALDLSYIIPISLRRLYQNHPEVQFKPGPFYMGSGVLGWSANLICISWTLFVCVIFSMPNILPVTPQNMNYASVSSSPVEFFI